MIENVYTHTQTYPKCLTINSVVLFFRRHFTLVITRILVVVLDRIARVVPTMASRIQIQAQALESSAHVVCMRVTGLAAKVAIFLRV